MSTPLSIEDFYDFTRPEEVSVSPGGDRVAFLATEPDPVADESRTSLFVVPTDGSRDPHRLTRASDASGPKWSPDGSKLGFLASRDEDVALSIARDPDEAGEDDGDDSDESATGLASPTQLWVFDLDLGGDARQLTDRDEGVREFDWSPTGDRVVFSSRDPTGEQIEYLRERRDGGPIEVRRLQHQADGQGYLDDVATYLFVADVATRAVTRLDDAYGAGASEPLTGLQPAWGPGPDGGDGRIAFVSNLGADPDRDLALDVYVVEPDGANRTRLTEGDAAASRLSWGPDGERVAFVARDAVNWCLPQDVRVADVASGEVRSVSASLDRTVAWGGAPTWIDDDALLVPIGDGGWTRLARVDADGDAPERVWKSQRRDRTIGAFDAAGGTVALGYGGADEGTDVYAADVADLLADVSDDGEGGVDGDDAGDGVANAESDGGDPVEPTRLTRLNGDLFDDADLPRCTRVTFEDSDGVEVEGLVYYPPDAELDGDTEAEAGAGPDGRPLIVHIHGGPIAYDAPAFDFDYAHWTGKGYLVLNVNYRGSSSYGRAFTETIRGDWGPREADDVLSGVDELVARGWADPDRLFCSGFSQGGVNTAHVVIRDDRFAAAAPEHGVYDFYSLFGTADLHRWYVNDLGTPWENPEGYRGMSSLADVDEIETPLLITAGSEDWRCPPSQAEQLYVSVRERGVEAELVVYPGEHHNIGKPKRATHRLRRLTDWFGDHDPGREK